MTTIKVSRKFRSTVKPTPNVKACAAMFGLGINEAIEIVLYEDIEIPFGPGKVIYATGDSGAGKSTLIRDCSRELAKAGMTVVDYAALDEPPDEPLIDQFGDMQITEVGQLLAFVGISEPFVYLRTPGELSDGQRYRFMLARLIHDARQHDGPVVVVIDEFLAFLDRTTAKNVAFQTRKSSRKYGLCFLVATTHTDIAEDLDPDVTITMSMMQHPKVEL